MKKWLTIIGISVLALVGFVACGSNDGGTGDGFKIGMVLGGSVTDGGWNQTAHNGLVMAEKELGAEIFYNENTPPSDFEKVMREYAKDGCSLIIGHGFQFEDAAKAVASEYPDVKFVVTSSEVTNGTNLGSIQNNYKQCGFLQGAFAALMTKSNQIGGIGSTEIPPIINDLAGYEAGAKYINPDIKVTNVTTGSGDDASKVKEQALTYLSQGADIIMVDADHAGRGAYDATAEKGAWAIGSIAPEYDAYKTSLIACGEADMATAIEQVCAAVKDDTFEAKCYLKGVEEGIVDLTYNPALEDKIPEDVKAKISEIVSQIKDGKLDVEEYIKTK